MDYQRRLMALVRSMAADVGGSIRAIYEANVPLIAEDATPSEKLAVLMNDLRDRWEARFEREARSLASWFVGKVSEGVKRAQENAMRIAGLGDFAVRYDFGNIKADVATAAVSENVTLIKSIPSQYLTDVEGLVMRSVSTGRDLNGLGQELAKRYDITARRAALIARDQNNKATEAIARSNDIDAGMTHGEWIHVPGRKSSRESHVRMHGKIFDLREGLYDPSVGRKIMPGELVACNCTYRPIFDAKLWKNGSD